MWVKDLSREIDWKAKAIELLAKLTVATIRSLILRRNEQLEKCICCWGAFLIAP